MRLENDEQLANTQYKLGLLEQWIEEAKSRPNTPENDESVGSLIKMANQLREEIIMYRTQQTKKLAAQPAA